MDRLDLKSARRLALARAGLLKPEWTGFPARAHGRGKRARDGAHAVIRRFGYLQLDSIPVAGARTHGIVLLSRLEGFDPQLAEELLQPGEPLFEYWGHEASWIPIELYPAFGFRRKEYREKHPWFGDILTQHPELTREMLRLVEERGPIRSLDLQSEYDGNGPRTKKAFQILRALWMAGDLAIPQRRAFQRGFDLAERIIPEAWRGRDLPREEGLRRLLLLALDGHGWASTGTLAATWRLRNLRPQIHQALNELQETGEIVPCELHTPDRKIAGWVRPTDLELADRLRRVRPRKDQGVLLSPFDPVLWDRDRVQILFDFDLVLEIYKPLAQRVYGYYCLPVLAGERLVARIDLKADRKAGELHILALIYEHKKPTVEDQAAVDHALRRYAGALDLKLPHH